MFIQNASFHCGFRPEHNIEQSALKVLVNRSGILEISMVKIYDMELFEDCELHCESQ